MPFRDRVLIAAVGCLTALPASGEAEQKTTAPQWDAQTQQNPPSAYPTAVPVEIIEDKATAEARERKEAEAQQREVDDLLAQQGMNSATQAMNTATQKMAGYAYLSNWFVGVGTALLFVTLGLTRQANKAAQEAVAVTREIGQAQVRAYLTVADSAITPPDRSAIFQDMNGVKASVIFHNSGQSPALNARFRHKERTIGALIEDFDRGIDKEEFHYIGQVGAGGKFVYHIDNLTEQDEYRSLISGSAHSFFFGEIFYRDVFNEWWLVRYSTQSRGFRY
jgi:hypothetical protein